MVPSGYVLLDALPLLPSGKVDRKALDKMGGKLLEEQTEIVLPRTEVEKKLGEMWEELLRVGPVGIEANFFELGGHSLMVLQLIARMRRTFEIEIPVQTVFEQPTIAQLASEIQTRAASNNNLRASVRHWKARSTAVGSEADDLLTQLESLPQTNAQSILQRVLNDKRSA
jgi:acyl carrier protein